MVGPVPHGIARYALGLWNHLPARTDLTYVALITAGGERIVQARRPRDEISMARSRHLSPWEQLELPRLLRQSRADLLHATSFSVPRLWRGPLVVTLHDLTHLRHPELHGPGRRLYYRMVTGPAARRASAVLTVSHYEAREIARWLGLPEARIGVAAAAVVPASDSRPRSAESNPPLLLYVGNGKPHKNVELLIRARAAMAQPARLALVGERLERFAGPGIVVHPRVDDTTLFELYRAATLFLFPSLSEGFGLPPLEAALAGTPVLVADAAALPEIWRGVAPLLPPNDALAWASAIDRLLRHPDDRAQLAARCASHAARYLKWDPLLELAERSYREGLSQPPGARDNR